MVPSELVIMSDFPYLPSGKINKKQLEADYLAKRTEVEDEASTTLTPTELSICKIVEEMLGLKVNKDKRLASYGLDSLGAIRLATLLRKGNLSITPVAILSAETLSGIASAIDSKSTASAPTKEATFNFSALKEPVRAVLANEGVEDEVEEVMPCTPLQDAMLLQTAVDKAAYNNFIELSVSGSDSAEEVVNALMAWMKANPILRTGFVSVASEFSAYTQVIFSRLSERQVQVIEQEAEGAWPISALRPLSIKLLPGSDGGESKLYLSLHHALYDGWSLECLITDLHTILAGGEMIQRPGFRTIVEEQLGLGQKEKYTEEQYWRDHLAQLDPQGLPSFHSTAKVERGLAQASKMTEIETRELESVARELEVSPQSIVQAAYAVLLGQYLGRTDVCFGTIFSGRTGSIEGVQDIAGPTLSTLPVRYDTAGLVGSGSLAMLAQGLNATIRKHLENDVLPLRSIKALAELGSNRSLFDTLVIWQQTLDTASTTTEQQSLVKLVRSRDYLEFNLTLEITPLEKLRLDVNYQTAILPREMVDVFLGQLEGMVGAFVQNAEIGISEVSRGLGTDLLSVANPEPRTQVTEASMASAVEKMAVSNPRKSAIDFVKSVDGEFEVETATYKQLNERANRIAHFLRSRNVKPDQLVAVCMDKSLDLYTSILAAIKSGAGYLPLTTDTPLDRIATIVKDADVEIILTAGEISAHLRQLEGAEVVAVDTQDWSQYSDSNPSVVSTPDNLAYAVFTSGSTGTPKGVLINQVSVLANLATLESVYPHSEKTRLLQSCSQGFDVSVFDIFFTWAVGGTLVSAKKDTIFVDIEKLVNESGVTHLSLTPTVAALVNPDNVPSVEVLMSAGEAMTPKVFQTWSGKGLYNAYGPSETTNVVTVAPSIKEDDVLASIGRPLDTVSAFVLAPLHEDAREEEKEGDGFEVLPLGAEGELCCGGPQVARGYLDSVQNRGNFITHSIHGRIYRTGDFGRLLHDGSIIYAGRKDDQVKIRGQRVELGEINRVVLGGEGVDDCVTQVIEGEKEHERRLVTFYTLKESKGGNEFKILEAQENKKKALYSELMTKVPIYMVPSSLVPVSTFPPTLVGKVDKRLLKSAYASLTPSQLESYSNSEEKAAADYEWSELEKTIVGAVPGVAKVQEGSVGPNTSFFALGIDSISAISLVRNLRDEHNLKVEISDVLKHSSVSRLAAHIAKCQKGDKGGAETPEMLPTPEELDFSPEFLGSVMEQLASSGKQVERVLPCTPLQEAMLSACELTSSGEAYQNRVVLDIKVSVEAMQRAWTEMVRRHEILRTVFVKSGDAKYAYSQVVLTSYSHNARIIEAQTVEEALKTVSTTDTDLEPPYSLVYVNLSEEGGNGEVKLVLGMHHALYDGFAMGVLFNEIEKFLRCEELGAPVSFAPFLRYMTGVDEGISDGYWRGLLRDFSPVSFVKGETEAVGKSSQVITKPTTVSLSWVEGHLKTHSTSLLAVCQAAWAATLAAQTKSSDIVFGNVVSGRTVPVAGLNNLVAPCFNTVPFRLRGLHKLSFMEACRQLQAQNIDALPYQLTALRRIQGLAGTEGKSLFDSLLLLQTPSTPLDDSLWRIEEDEGSMDLPVVVEIVPVPESDELRVTVHTHDMPLGAKQVEQILATFSSYLQSALENPRAQIISAEHKDQYAANTITLGSAKETEGEAKEESSNWTEVEGKVRDIISRFTTVPSADVKKSTSIYRLGLDSINAVQVATLLRKEGWKVAASDVLQCPSIKDLSQYIESLSSDVETSVAAAFDFAAFENRHKEAVLAKVEESGGNREVEGIKPCTPVQSGMLALTLHSGGREYVNSFSMELAPRTDVQKLRSAWEKVMQACEMLRMGFVGIEDAKYPFAMVTYKSLSLPWFTNDQDAVMDAESLATRPWLLTHTKGEGKESVKFTAQHALYDAASLQLILSDVQSAYTTGSVSAYTPITSVLGCILAANSGEQGEAKKFWTSKAIHQHKFPDCTPLRVSFTKSVAHTSTSRISMNEVEDLAKNAGVSVQAAGQVAWARLLSQYVGEPSVTFGVTLSGKSILGGKAARAAFPTIVTLPVSADVLGKNGEVLERQMGYNSQLSKFQFTPLTKIGRWAGVEGGLFDTLFAYQKTGGDTKEAGDGLWCVTDEDASADYAVSIEMLPTEKGELELTLTVKENVVPAEQAELMLKQFDALLYDTLSSPSHLADGLVLEDADDEMKKNILSITPPEHPTLGNDEDLLLHDFVSASATKNPVKTALEFTTCLEPLNTRKWSYRQLEEEANRIANLVQKLGVVQGQLVATCFDKCPEASFSIVGIMKSGSAYVALDPGAPGDRVKFIIEDSGASVILTSGKPAENVKNVFADSEIKVIDLDDDGIKAQLAECSTGYPKLSRQITPQDTSYCLYTSGTTGKPKGCELTHENAVQAMHAFTHLFADNYTAESRWLQFASFHFDVSVLEQFWTWKTSLCLSSSPRDLIFEDIPLAINALGITHLDLTPSLARLLTPEMVPGLTKGVFITGGEALRQDILDTWGEVGCIYNGYGPTEATIGCTMYPRVGASGKPANIGPQFLNVGSFVVKKDSDEPVLRGAVGELVVSGKLVGKGYLNREKLTEEKFPMMHGERVYRTGDLVRITHDGSFLFLGRADDQVKLRGQRLELSEITQVIKSGVEGIDEVVTLVLKHAKQEKEQLVAFFVPERAENNRYAFIGKAKEACLGRLPGYMVPTHFVPLGKLPLSANNKADGKALASVYNSLSIDDLQRLSSAGNTTRTWSEDEKEVLETLADAMIVPIEDLKTGTNIFELGYDSISVIGLSQRLQRAGFESAKLASVMKNSGIDGLVKLLLADSNGLSAGTLNNGVVAAQQVIKAFGHGRLSEVAEELGVEAGEIETVAPCTAAQAGMIYRFLDSEDALYFSSFDFEVGGDVDMEMLKEAWSKVQKRLEVLRMCFVLTGDGCAQVVLKDVELLWNIVKVENDSDVDKARKTIGERYKEMEKTAALANPWRVTIIQADKKKLMAIDMFHGLYDGVAFPLILDAVAAEYAEQAAAYGPSFLSSLPHGPLAVIDGAKEFWTAALEGAVHTPLPLVENVREGDKENDVVVSKTLGDLEHLEGLRKKLGVTYQSIIQAVWTVVLQNYTGAGSAPMFGLVASGRSIDFADAEKVVGPLLNTLVFHAATEKGQNWEELIRACGEFNSEVLPYQHTALKDVMKWCAGGQGGELFDSLFVFQHEEESKENGLWKEVEGVATADYPLAFEATLREDGGLGLTLVGQGSYLDEKVAGELLGKVEAAFAALKSPESAIPFVATSGTTPAKTASIKKVTQVEDDAAFEWSETAATIRAEIAALTKVDKGQVQPYTTLFSLGLDSIDVIKLASRLKSKGVKISVSALIKAGCVAKMMRSITSSDAAPAKVTIKIEDLGEKIKAALIKEDKIKDDDEQIEAVLPATPLQEGMVAVMISSEYTRYLNHELYKLSSDTDMERLKGAWEECIRAHSILRTSFVEIEDTDIDTGYAQVVSRYTPTTWCAVNVSAEDNLEDVVARKISKAIEIAKEKGRLLQLREITHGEDRYYLLSISHALYDGWSLDALHGDVVAAYNGQDISRPDPRKTLEGVVNANGADAVRYWKTALTGLPRSTFPVSSTTSGVINRAEKTSLLCIAELQAFARQQNISLQTLGQTAWSVLLATYLKKLDVAFGVVLSCRDEEEARRVMMPLMNTVPIRSVLSGTVADMLEYVQENANKVREFQHFPLRRAQALANMRGTEGAEGGALFDTLFIFQGGREDARTDGEDVEGMGGLYTPAESQSEVEFAVCVEMEIVGESLVWRTACRDEARTESQTSELLEQLDGVLNSLVSKADEEILNSTTEGISILGLPPFALESSGVAKPVNRVTRGNTPWSDTEKAIREVLAKVSKTEENDITRETSIFHLGLDSISAIKLGSLLRKQGLHIGVNEIIKNPTLSGIASIIEGRNAESETVNPDTLDKVDADAVIAKALEHLDRTELLASADIREEDVENILPLAAGQLYTAQRFRVSGGSLFSSKFEYATPDSLDLPRLEAVWAKILKRHAVLRSKVVLGLAEIGGVQIIAKSTAYNNLVVTKSEDTKIVDLLNPVQFSVIDGKLSLQVLHVLYDASSLDRVLDELQQVYGNPETELPGVDTEGIKNFVAAGLSERVKGQQEEFWRSYLPHTTATDKAADKSSTGHKTEYFQPRIATSDLKATAREAGVSVDAYVLSAIGRVWSSHKPGASAIGLYLGNRSASATESLAAPTLNLLPLKIGDAASVQADLGKLGDEVISQTRLEDVYTWTGESVDVWVNLLKSTGESTNLAEPSGDDTGLLSRSLNAGAMLGPRAEVKEIVKVEDSGDRLAAEVYKRAVDIELRVVDDGTAIDVGVFGDEDMMSLDRAKELVEELRKVLGGEQ